MKIELTKENVKRIGRSLFFSDTLFLSLSGSGIEFEYTGKGFLLTLVGGSAALLPDNSGNYARVAIYQDGVRILDTQLTAAETAIRLGESETEKASIFRILKLSECAMSLMGIKALEVGENDMVKPTPQKTHCVEFIGDSITCGYGVDDEDPLHPFQTATEDVTRAYAYKTASALQVDYSMFSTSGYGIISGYTADPAIKMTNQRIPDFYESMGFSYDRIEGIPAPMELAWNFEELQPDAIVINLGTNDDSYCQEDQSRQQEYTAAYVEFLKVVRKHNPGAIIFCVLGLMGDRLYPSVCEAAKAYTEQTGDVGIHTVHLPEQDASVGYVSDYHPLESAHEKAAKVLVPEIKRIMNW